MLIAALSWQQYHAQRHALQHAQQQLQQLSQQWQQQQQLNQRYQQSLPALQQLAASLFHQPQQLSWLLEDLQQFRQQHPQLDIQFHMASEDMHKNTQPALVRYPLRLAFSSRHGRHALDSLEQLNQQFAPHWQLQDCTLQRQPANHGPALHTQCRASFAYLSTP